MGKKTKGNESAVTGNPYVDGKREWMERYGSYIQEKKMWQGVAFTSIAVTAISVLGAISLAKKSEFVPYVVEIDKLGQIKNISQPNGNFKPETKHIQGVLVAWLEHTRAVWTDSNATRKSIEKSFAHISKGDPSFIYLSQFSKTNWKRATEESVAIEIIGEPLPITSKTWQIEWKETVKSRSGEMLREEIWRGNFECYFATPTTQKLILNNPLGVQIRTISWSKQKVTKYTTSSPNEN